MSELNTEMVKQKFLQFSCVDLKKTKDVAGPAETL